jgi:electron transfer flavoprotein beta subunit
VAEKLRIVLLVRRLRARPDGAPAPRLLGSCDEAALAAALALRGDSHELTVVTAGPADREDAVLKHALERGADRARRVHDGALDKVDYHVIARVLSAAVKLDAFDLVIAGDRSEDEGQGATGPAVAEALAIPHVSSAIDLHIEEKRLTLVRRDGGQTRTIQVGLPALVTIASFPRAAPALTGSVTNIEPLDLEKLGIEALELKPRASCIGQAKPIRASRNATVVAGADELIARLRDDRLLDH